MACICIGIYSYRSSNRLAEETKDFFMDQKQKAAFEDFKPRIRPMVGGPLAAFQSSSYKTVGVLAIVVGVIGIIIGVGAQH
jgi:hypothetical protein